MADEARSNQDALFEALIDMIKSENSPEMMKIKRKLLERITNESDIKPSRIPAPRNITELGGYYNLLEKLRDKEMQKNLIASALGLPMK